MTIVEIGASNSEAAIARRQAIRFFNPGVVLFGGEATDSGNLAGVYAAMGNYVRSIELYHSALMLHREVGNRSKEASTLANPGVVYEAIGDNCSATAYNEQHMGVRRTIGDSRSRGKALLNDKQAFDKSED